MTLSELDRQLLDRCLDNEPNAWEAFVNRFLGMVIHVVNHTASSRGIPVSAALRDDLVSEVFVVLLTDNRAVLRRFRRQSSLATYLAVVARRVIVRKLMMQHPPATPAGESVSQAGPTTASAEQQIDDRDQVEQLLARLDGQEAVAVRMHHLEGRSYHEIGQHLGVSENSVGPLLSRARQKMRQGEQL